MDRSSGPGIKDVPVGKVFTGFCVVRGKERKFTRKNAPYLVLELGDHSGRLKARIWDKLDHYDGLAEVGSIVKVQALVEEFNNAKTLSIQKMRAVSPDDSVRSEDFLPKSECDINQLKAVFNRHLEAIGDPHLSSLLRAILADAVIGRAYFEAPSGKLWHHNYLHGMLENVVALLDLAEVVAKHHPLVDLDLLRAGIICHDIGTVKEFACNGFIEYSDEGRLLGHVAMGYALVDAEIFKHKDFPVELKNRLLHMILSHQSGWQENPMLQPMTLEAMILQNLIQLNANTNAITRILRKDVLPGSSWSKYIPLLDRFIYAGENPEDDKSQDNQA